MMLFPSTLFAYRPELRSETSLRGLHLYARIKTSRKWSYLTRVTRKPPPPPNIQTCRGVHLHILSRWLQNKPSQTAMETFASRVVKTRPGDLSVTPASLRKTRASRLCVKNKSWHCRRTVQHPPPPPPCSNRLTRHDCPSTGHVNQRLMQHSNADDSQASTENVWTPSCQISHERHKDEISRRGVEFKKNIPIWQMRWLNS